MSNNILGNLFLVSAPSGGGKTSLVKALLEQMVHVQVSVSYTTRSQRPGEIPGKHYHFIDESVFKDMIQDQALLEYALVHGNYYGTGKAWLLETLAKGVDVILEIDWQGAHQIRQLFPEAISIFLLPPSREILLERLQARQQDAPEVIAKRMDAAIEEMRHCKDYDYLIINQDFSMALAELCSIVSASRLRAMQQTKRYEALLTNLLSEK